LPMLLGALVRHDPHIAAHCAPQRLIRRK
jgi:hypothetical protein